MFKMCRFAFSYVLVFVILLRSSDTAEVLGRGRRGFCEGRLPNRSQNPARHENITPLCAIFIEALWNWNIFYTGFNTFKNMRELVMILILLLIISCTPKSEVKVLLFQEVFSGEYAYNVPEKKYVIHN